MSGLTRSISDGDWLRALPSDGACPTGPEEALVEAVASGVLPRLFLALAAQTARHSSVAPAVARPRAVPVAMVEAMVPMVLDDDVAPAAAQVAGLHEEGIPVEAIYLDLLAPVARRLGDLWVSDALDVTQVTLGVGRLSAIMHGLSPAFHGEGEPRTGTRRAALATAPGEQHSFGLSMVGEFFRRAGWHVHLARTRTAQALTELVRDNHLDLLGLSIAGERHVETLASCIRAVRRASRNSTLGIMVGGPLVTLRPELALQVGADATAADASQAPAHAELLVALQIRRKSESTLAPERGSARRKTARHYPDKDDKEGDRRLGLQRTRQDLRDA